MSQSQNQNQGEHNKPEGVVPYLNIHRAKDAVSFYQRAFGAEELFRLPSDDGQRLIHCCLRINGGNLMLSDCGTEAAEASDPARSVTMHLQVKDVDAWWKRALAASAEVTMPLQEMFWGDKYGRLRDPFGVSWSLAAPIKAA